MTRQGWLLVAVAALVAFIANGSRLSFGVFVVPWSDAFTLTRSQAVLPFALSMVVWGLFQPITGMLMDSRGPRVAILGSLVAMTLGFVITASAQSFWQLTLGYGLLVGSSASGLTVAAFSILISRRFGPEHRGKALGLVIAAIPAGGLAFAPLASALAYGWRWQGAFLVLAAAIGLVALPLAWFFLRGSGSAPDAGPGTSPKVGGLFSPEVRRAVRTRPYWVLLVAYFGCGSSGFFLQSHLPAIALGHGFSPQVGAFGLGLIGAAGSLGAIAGGLAADRFGRYRTLAVGYFMRGLGFLVLTFLVSNEASFFVAILILAFPIYVTITVTQTLIYEIFGAGIAGRMLGLTFVLHQVGSTLGPYLGGYLYEARGDYTLALLLGAGVLFFSSLMASYFPRAMKRSSYVPA